MVSSLTKLYTDCKKLPLSIFIDCLLDSDYSGLILNGTPTEKELQDAWMKIFAEYSVSVNDETHNEIFIKTKAINLIVSKIYIIENLCSNLRHDHNEQACKILNGYALKCDLKEDDPFPVRHEKIDLILSRAGRFTTQLDKLKLQLKEAQKNSVQGEGGSDYFDDMLNVMSETAGYMIRASDITVSRFVKMIQKMRARQTTEKLKTMKNGA